MPHLIPVKITHSITFNYLRMSQQITKIWLKGHIQYSVYCLSSPDLLWRWSCLRSSLVSSYFPLTPLSYVFCVILAGTVFIHISYSHNIFTPSTPAPQRHWIVPHSILSCLTHGILMRTHTLFSEYMQSWNELMMPSFLNMLHFIWG